MDFKKSLNGFKLNHETVKRYKNRISHSEIENRACNIGKYIKDNNATIRKAANEFKISKTSAHLDVTERLKKINPILAKDVRKVLDKNKGVRHIRGGEATKLKHNSLNYKNSRELL